jgi:hypothetical protein
LSNMTYYAYITILIKTIPWTDQPSGFRRPSTIT